MAWSYDITDLNTTTAAGRLNSVRLLIGDTDTLDQQLQNEEIVFGLALKNNDIYYSGAWSAKAIAATYARRVSTEVSGALKAEYSDLAAQYDTLADKLDYQGKTSGASIGFIAGGLTVADTKSVRANTNRVKPAFRMHQFKNPPDYSED